MSIEHLQRAVALLGGQTETARVLSALTKRKLTQAHVWNWLNSTNQEQMPPAEYCPAIELATTRQVRCEDLRPDVEWAVLRCQSRPDEAAHEERGTRNNELQEA